MEDQKGAPFHIQPVCSVGTNDGAKRTSSIGQGFDCHLTLASNRDGHKDEGAPLPLCLDSGSYEQTLVSNFSSQLLPAPP
jgi:hypothetical protein